MIAITYSHARRNLAKTMDQISKDHLLIIITHKNQRSAVIVILDDDEAPAGAAKRLEARKILKDYGSLLPSFTREAARNGSCSFDVPIEARHADMVQVGRPDWFRFGRNFYEGRLTC